MSVNADLHKHLGRIGSIPRTQLFSGVTSEIRELRLTAMLAPPTLAGVIVGHILSSRISEVTFRWILTIILAFTAFFLFAKFD